MNEKESFIEEFREWFGKNYPDEEVLEVDYTADYRNFDACVGIRTSIGRELSVTELRGEPFYESMERGKVRSFTQWSEMADEYDLVAIFDSDTVFD